MGSTSGNFRARDYLNWPLLGILLAWGVLITQARHHWGGESYYNFGMFVPFLAAWLWLKNFHDHQPVPGRRGGLAILLAAAAILCVVPFHALSEVNPFWRLPLWIQATGLVAFTGCAAYSLYGWPGVLRTAFPVFFLCMMIPWPWRLEQEIVQSLTRVVVTIAMWILHVIGYPVQLAGNNMTLGDLNIGVSDACSGIRSLQALFMVTLFLGSLFGQGAWRRLAALLILPLIVIVINAFRAVFLALQVIVNGPEGFDNWHDPAGYIAFGVSMVLIYACIELLNAGARRETPPMVLTKGALLGLLQARLPARAAAYAALPLLLWGVVEGWFRFKEAGAAEKPDWAFHAPADNGETVAHLPISKTVEEALGYDYITRFMFRSGGTTGEAYYYGYTEDNKLSSVSSYGHKPTICMDSMGATLLEQFADLRVQIDGLVFPMHHYLFEMPDGDQRMHVFWFVWEKRNMDIDLERLEDLDYNAQWVQLLHGRRDFSRRVVLVSLVTNAGEAHAKARLLPLLQQWIIPGRG